MFGLLKSLGIPFGFRYNWGNNLTYFQLTKAQDEILLDAGRGRKCSIR